MLHNLQLLLLRRAQQGRRGRVRYIVPSKEQFYSPEIEELIDRFGLELPETVSFFQEEAPQKPVEAVIRPSVRPSIPKPYEGLQRVIKELTEALAKAEAEDLKRSLEAAKASLEVIKARKKKKIREEEELLLELLL